MTLKANMRGSKRPSRARYWASGKLRKHKVRNLIRCCRMTRADAEKLWDAVRTRHA